MVVIEVQGPSLLNSDDSENKAHEDYRTGLTALHENMLGRPSQKLLTNVELDEPVSEEPLWSRRPEESCEQSTCREEEQESDERENGMGDDNTLEWQEGDFSRTTRGIAALWSVVVATSLVVTIRGLQRFGKIQC